MKPCVFTGSAVATVTPFCGDGVDLEAFDRLIKRQIQGGTDAIVVCGTTGEAATLSYNERMALIERCVRTVDRRVPVIAGSGTNSTASSIALSKAAQSAGVDALLTVTPYYNKASQSGLVQHFSAIADAVDIPVILYNVPGRTVADLSNETALRLAQIPNIVGIKDATGNMDRVCELIARAPQGFSIYSGDDPTACFTILMGGKGNISVVANVAPRLMHEMCVAALAGDLAKARELHFRLQGLHRQLFCEANPIPVKWAMERMGYIPSGIRLPLTRLSEACQPVVEAAMRQAQAL